MPISGGTEIAFCNDKVRVWATRCLRLYRMAQAVKDEWYVRGGDAFIPDGAEVVDDGADQDGRPVITGAQVNKLMELMEGFIATVQAGTRLADLQAVTAETL